jgi:hypothetical protein
MCYHHRTDQIQSVIENDPFEIVSLAGHDDIERALTDVAARLACNHMDFKRAELLIQTIRVAVSNLSAKERLLANAANPDAVDPPDTPAAVDTAVDTADNAIATAAPDTPAALNNAVILTVAKDPCILSEVPIYGMEAEETVLEPGGEASCVYRMTSVTHGPCFSALDICHRTAG